MTKSDLIDIIAQKQSSLMSYKEIESAVKILIDQIAQSLENGERVEIRGFGSFSLHYRPPRIGRNPKTGASVHLNAKYVPHFKAGKLLRERVKTEKSATVS